jgi:hypothetical protein
MTLVPSRIGLGVVLGTALGLAVAIVAGGIYLYRTPASTTGSQPAATAPISAPDQDTAAIARLAVQMRGNDDQAFQVAANELAKLATAGKPAAAKLAATIANENGVALESQASRSARQRAWNRLKRMADAQNDTAARRVAAFEKTYDEMKKQIANSAWWLQGQGAAPDDAPRWMENGAILADGGDRPAMLDQAFAVSHGRAQAQDRATAVQIYLKVIARANAGDEVSARIRTAAGHGLAATLNAVVEQKDEAAARALQPVLAPMANAGAADMQYFVGLFDECVTQPANLNDARRLYQLAATDPVWKTAAEKKLGLIGRWCPGGAG